MMIKQPLEANYMPIFQAGPGRVPAGELLFQTRKTFHKCNSVLRHYPAQPFALLKNLLKASGLDPGS